MKDPEFYTFEENWPQPPDDSCTLEPVEPVTHNQKKRSKASSAKVKKKMSESLAGVTAAAVAVVMLSTSIPTLKDAFDDFPELPDFGEPVEVCTVCNSEHCPYFVDGYPGLMVSLESEVERVETEDIFSMPGFTTDADLHWFVNYPCIFTEDGKRIVLRIKNDFVYTLPIADKTEEFLESNARLEDTGEPAYSGQIYHGEDEKSPGQSYYISALIVSSAQGDVPKITPEKILSDNSHVEFDPEAPNYCVREIPGVPDAQLQVCSNLDIELLEQLMDYLDVSVVEDAECTYDLGQTMRFTETGVLQRTFNDLDYRSTTSYPGFNTENGNETHPLCQDFYSKDYSIYGYNIIFNQVGWKAVFDRWRDLNEDAPETGHEVYFPMEELNSYTINGIEYTCYIVYSAGPVDDVNGYPWIWYYFVPKQEETIAIVDRRSISPENLKKLLETLDVETAVPPEDILRQITLR